LDEKDFSKTEQAPDGAYVYGLFLEGCRYDPELRTLEESHPKVLFTKMPYIWMKPTKFSDIGEAHSYTCPVYKTLSRFGTLSTTGHSTNFVTMVMLPMQRRSNEAHWVKRGVAMIT
jgi:dynein heavy chain